jgi:DnaK suppressor protein
MKEISQKLLKEFESKLKKEKNLLEGELKKIAKKNGQLKGDWEAQFPIFNGEIAGAALETGADETEEYSTRLGIEGNLEKKLGDINLALEKIKKGQYGICEKCKKPISLARLRAYPEARTCQKCKK